MVIIGGGGGGGGGGRWVGCRKAKGRKVMPNDVVFKRMIKKKKK